MGKISLADRIYGCMIGGAVGDAMGFPTEGMHFRKIRRLYGRVENPMIREGTDGWDPPVDGPVYTDDTVMKHMVCEAIFAAGGRITIQAAAEVWRRTITNYDQWVWWQNTRVVAVKLRMNPLIPLRDVGRDSIPCNDAAMIVGPIGIVNAGDPSRAAVETWDVSSLWQTGYSRECAAAMAACHAEALRPDASVESIVETACKYSPTMKPYIDTAMKTVGKSADTDDFTERFYADCLEFPNQEFWQRIGGGNPDWSFGADPVEVCTEALAFLALSGGDGRKAIRGAINFGRDCDTIAGIAAALCGALNGPDTIPLEWREEIIRANPVPDIGEYSARLHELLLRNLEALARQVEELSADK